jgi:thiamine-monophosphate kinase
MGEDEGDEFDIIARYFQPLADPVSARDLLDDVAVLDTSGPLVVTTDAIVESVHFRAADPMETIARKALRVNLSDLIAKGATPLGYVVSLQWPRSRPATQIAAFAAGLREDQAAFGLKLFGGDTTTTPGPLAVSVTMWGRSSQRTPARADAQAGDELWVLGPIGDGWLGLAACEGKLTGLSPNDQHVLAARYQVPAVQPAAGLLVQRFAKGSMDVSDGLIGDAMKMAAVARVGLELNLAGLPLSPEARAWLALQPDQAAARQALASGGDDYCPLVSVAPAEAAALQAEAAKLGLVVGRVGQVTADPAMRLLDGGQLPEDGGHRHRLGA